MKNKIINVIKKMGTGLVAANSNGAMGSTTHKSKILQAQHTSNITKQSVTK